MAWLTESMVREIVVELANNTLAMSVISPVQDIVLDRSWKEAMSNDIWRRIEYSEEIKMMIRNRMIEEERNKEMLKLKIKEKQQRGC